MRKRQCAKNLNFISIQSNLPLDKKLGMYYNKKKGQNTSQSFKNKKNLEEVRMKAQIRHHKIYQDDREWQEVQDYVKQLQKLHDEFSDQQRWSDFVNTGHEIKNWFVWFGILQNWHDTDWAVDPVSGKHWIW